MYSPIHATYQVVRVYSSAFNNTAILKCGSRSHCSTPILRKLHQKLDGLKEGYYCDHVHGVVDHYQELKQSFKIMTEKTGSYSKGRFDADNKLYEFKRLSKYTVEPEVDTLLQQRFLQYLRPELAPENPLNTRLFPCAERLHIASFDLTCTCEAQVSNLHSHLNTVITTQPPLLFYV